MHVVDSAAMIMLYLEMPSYAKKSRILLCGKPLERILNTSEFRG